MSKTFDTIILGSGFGGSLLGAILSRQGQRVAIIDRNEHPRFAVGESSTPAADMLLHDLALRYEIEELLPLCRFGTWRDTYPEIRCGCKRGFSYFWHGEGQGYQSTEDHQDELLVAASASRDVADTQWYRADVDHFLFKIALQSGVAAFENFTVSGIEHQSEYDWLVTMTRDGRIESIHSSFIIDASGPAGLLLNRLNIGDETSTLKTDTSAVFSHFDNVPSVEDWLHERGSRISDFPFPADDSAVHHVCQQGWLWQLRFEDGPASLGFVSPIKNFIASHTPSRIDNNLLSDDLFAEASLSKSPGTLIRTGRMQRLRSQGAGPDWAALPFTIGFIDPLHSTGIAHTLSGVHRLAEILIGGQHSNGESRLASYSREVIQELRLIDQLVAGCYLSLAHFKLFTTWCMLYFAAATSFEKSFQSGQRDFLCASDPAWRNIVSTLFDRLESLIRNDQPIAEQIESFTHFVAEKIARNNHVGLFAPSIRNMYSYTAAEKPRGSNSHRKQSRTSAEQ